MEQKLSPEFARMYEKSPKVSVGGIYLGRDLAMERGGQRLEKLPNPVIAVSFWALFIANGFPLLMSLASGLVIGEVLEVLNGGIGIERGEREDIYQREY